MFSFRPALLWLTFPALFSLLSAAHADDSLGRLFLTPAERAQLDALRDPAAPQPATDPAALSADGTVLVNGIVRRSGGADVVWVNGTRTRADSGQADSRQPVQLRHGPDKNNRVTLDADGTVVRLKPGQLWDPATGLVADCFGCAAASRPGVAAPAAPAAAVAPTAAVAPAAAAAAAPP